MSSLRAFTLTACIVYTTVTARPCFDAAGLGVGALTAASRLCMGSHSTLAALDGPCIRDKADYTNPEPIKADHLTCDNEASLFGSPNKWACSAGRMCIVADRIGLIAWIVM